jgi:hypothetical protein
MLAGDNHPNTSFFPVTRAEHPRRGLNLRYQNARENPRTLAFDERLEILELHASVTSLPELSTVQLDGYSLLEALAP